MSNSYTTVIQYLKPLSLFPSSIFAFVSQQNPSILQGKNVSFGCFIYKLRLFHKKPLMRLR